MKVLILGSGVVGTASAYYLAKAGHEVTVLARGRGGGTAPGVGWAALCRLVTETHLRGERGVPVTSPDLLATWSHPAAPDSDFVRFAHGSRTSDAARTVCKPHEVGRMRV